MAIERLFCVNLNTTNLQTMIRFYRDVLQLPVQFPGFSADGDGIKFGFGNGGMMICLWDNTRWGKNELGRTEIALRGDLASTYEQIKQTGYPIEPIQRMRYGDLLEIYDPDGNRLAMMAGDE